jgi:hypothetical protein
MIPIETAMIWPEYIAAATTATDASVAGRALRVANASDRSHTINVCSGRFTRGDALAAAAPPPRVTGCAAGLQGVVARIGTGTGTVAGAALGVGAPRDVLVQRPGGHEGNGTTAGGTNGGITDESFPVSFRNCSIAIAVAESCHTNHPAYPPIYSTGPLVRGSFTYVARSGAGSIIHSWAWPTRNSHPTCGIMDTGIS